MHRSFRVIMNAAVLAGVIWTLVHGSEGRISGVLPSAQSESVARSHLGALEASVALSPTESNVVELATSYLDRDQPGLACAVIEKAPRAIRDSAEVSMVMSRALFRGGYPREALATIHVAGERCEESAGFCSSWQVAKMERQRAFLAEVVAAGIEDPGAEPEATWAAYDRSTREVRMVSLK